MSLFADISSTSLPVSGLPGMPTLTSISVANFGFNLFDISATIPSPSALNLSLVSATPWNLLGDPRSMVLDVFAFSIAGIRLTTNISFTWQGNVVGTVSFPSTVGIPVDVTILVPFPMSRSSPAKFVMPTAAQGQLFTLGDMLYSLPLPISVDPATIPGISDTVNSLAVTELEFVFSANSARRRSTTKTGHTLSYFAFGLQSTRSYSVFGILNVSSFNMTMARDSNISNSLFGWINGTITLGANGNPVTLSIPFPLSPSIPIQLRPQLPNIAPLLISDMISLVPGGSPSISGGDFQIAGSTSFPDVFELAVIEMGIFMNGSKFSNLFFSMALTSPWIFSSGGSSNSFALDNALFSFEYNRLSTPKIQAYVSTTFDMDGTTVGIAAWIPFATQSNLVLYADPFSDPNAYAAELAICPQGTISFACSEVSSVQFTLAPAFITSPLTADTMVNPNALTVGKAMSWIMPSALNQGLESIGLQSILNSFVVTSLRIKFQGAVSDVAFSLKVQQTQLWTLFDGRLTVSQAEIDIRRQITTNGAAHIFGEVYAVGTFQSTAPMDSCSPPDCPVDVILFLAFPSDRNPPISNSIMAVNPQTLLPTALTLRHVIYTLLGLDIVEQGWNFPMPPGVGDIFTEWMNIGVQYLYWSTDSTGRINRLNSSMIFPGQLEICLKRFCPLKCSSLSVAVAITPAIPSPKFRVLGTCIVFSGEPQIYDHIFPPKSGVLLGPVTIKSMSVVFAKDRLFFGFDVKRWANITVLFDRNNSFTLAQNAYALQCQMRTLNTTEFGPIFNSSDRVDTIYFGEAGSDNPWLDGKNDYANTIITAPFDNYGNRRFFRCRICVAKSSTSSYCSDWYDKLNYANYNVDTFSTSGNSHTNTTVVNGAFSSTQYVTKVVNNNPIVENMFNNSIPATVYLTLTSAFSFKSGNNPKSMNDIILDIGDGRPRKISEYSKISSNPLILALTFGSPGFYNVYFEDTFVVEILIYSTTVEVQGPVITFTGSFLPHPLYRGFESTKATVGSVLALDSHHCFAIANAGLNKVVKAVILPTGAIVCDTTMSTPASLHGNLTLRLNIQCSSKLQPGRCTNDNIIRAGWLDSYTVYNIYLFKLFGKLCQSKR